MDSAVWREFPADLQERVLALLPPPLLFRFRVVCKSWNALLTTPSFCELCALIPQPNSYVLVAPTFHGDNYDHYAEDQPDCWQAYDVTADRWYRIPNDFLLSHFKDCDECTPGPINISTVGAAGGLICVLCTTGYYAGKGSLAVCNPIAKTVKDLPRLTARDHKEGDKVVLVADKVTNSYKIFVIYRLSLDEDKKAGDRFHVYESITQRWRSLAKVPKRSIVISSIFFQGILYTLFDVGAGSRHALLAYDIQANSWMETGVQIPESVHNPQLVVTNGGLYLFGGLENVIHSHNAGVWIDVESWVLIRTLCIWELQISSKSCVELEGMPNCIMEGTLYTDHDDVAKRLGINHVAFFTAVGFGTSILITSWKGVTAIFELSERMWRLVPEQPWSADAKDQGLSANLINLNLGALV